MSFFSVCLFPNRRVRFLCMLILAESVSTEILSAAEVPHPVVAGFERFYADEKADLAAGGRLLLGELNCVSCHQPEGPVTHKQAPILDRVASRVRVDYLTKFLDDPQAVKPGTTMPNLFAGDPDKKAKIEALVNFLAQTGSLKQKWPDIRATLAGQGTYAKVGCVACHGPRDLLGQPAKDQPPYAVPLGDLKQKYTIVSLESFLENPLQTRPSGRMPHLLNAKDAHDVANYLLQSVKIELPQGVGTTAYAYYEGNWEKLPDFGKLKPKASGVSHAFDLNVARRADNYGVKFEGYFKAEREGDYEFRTSSDDGSRLLIDGKLVVDNDGIHSLVMVSRKTNVTKGTHKVTVEYMQSGAGAELAVEFSGPGMRKQNFADFVAPTEAALELAPESKTHTDGFFMKQALLAKGMALFASAGCASCHQLNVDRQTIAAAFSAPSLARLNPEGGCLADKPGKGAASYNLSSRQKAALTAALKSPSVDSKEPAAVIATAMTTLNCYACHTRNKLGGPTEDLNKFFLTAQQEMGDEGRVPPPLDGVGAKLNAAYFKQILDKGAHDRPYMQTHMPGFGAANVEYLQPLFAGLDSVPRVAEIKFDFPEPKIYAAGRHMIGEQALSCIKCHTFNGVKAEGIQGIDMTLMPKRLNRDWFHFYVVDPQKYRTGTRMPSAFVNKVSPLPQVLDGKADTQIEAMWVYLKQGAEAALPFGMGKKSIPLRPLTEAIIYRNFIKGAGTRAIGVGYPEKVNLAFDANGMRLALIWQGAFIDAARHWTGRGEGFEGPLGDNVLSLPDGAPFAVLSKSDAPWPKNPAKEQGFKFKGYHLTPDERPTFEYSFEGVSIEDVPSPSTVGKEPSLKRVLKLSATSPVNDLYFRAAVGKKIETGADGWYKIDGWKMKIDSEAVPQIRQNGGKSELLVPVHFKDGKAQIVQEFLW